MPFASSVWSSWLGALGYSMVKCVIYTCLRETFPHLNAVPRQREGRAEREVLNLCRHFNLQFSLHGFKR